jgi:hypothetical protein
MPTLKGLSKVMNSMMCLANEINKNEVGCSGGATALRLRKVFISTLKL